MHKPTDSSFQNPSSHCRDVILDVVWSAGVSHSLVELDLEYNRIGNVGAKAIAEALKSSGSMDTYIWL